MQAAFDIYGPSDYSRRDRWAVVTSWSGCVARTRTRAEAESIRGAVVRLERARAHYYRRESGFVVIDPIPTDCQ